MIKTIFWDFDGVLINSNEIRDQGFIITLKEYPDWQVDQLMAFHHQNGGLSRYVKFKYFFENIRMETVEQGRIDELASAFSKIMRGLLVNPDLLIKENMHFIERNYDDFNMHIVSGSDGNELKYLCEEMDILKYFKSVHGSPTPKTQLVAELIAKNNYNKNECILIGDSINDYEAANDNNIFFKGYGNEEIIKLTNKEFCLISPPLKTL